MVQGLGCRLLGENDEQLGLGKARTSLSHARRYERAKLGAVSYSRRSAAAGFGFCNAESLPKWTFQDGEVCWLRELLLVQRRVGNMQRISGYLGMASGAVGTKWALWGYHDDFSCQYSR